MAANILMLNYEYPPLGGGAGIATQYLLKEFSLYRYLEIDLIVASSINKYRVEKPYSNVTIHFLNINKKGNFHYQSNKDLLLFSFKALKYAKKLVNKKKFDLCHAFFGIPCGYIAMMLKKQFNIPYIVSLMGSDIPYYNERFIILDRLIFNYLSKKIWINAKSVIALSHDSSKLAKKTSENQQIEIIYIGIDNNIFKPCEDILKNEKTMNILFVGRLIKRKGLIYLLNAFKELAKKYPKLRLDLAGSGPLLNTFKTYIQRENLMDEIRLHEVISHNKINELYQKAHIFVLPSLNEALGIVMLEAMASGLPIITTNTGAAELIDGNGIIINKASSKEIYESIETLLTNDELRLKMSEKSRNIAAYMTWEKAAEEYYKIYTQI